jgi:hypothetical protein
MLWVIALSVIVKLSSVILSVIILSVMEPVVLIDLTTKNYHTEVPDLTFKD